MLKCDFNKVALHGCSPVNLLHIFRTPFPRNTSRWLLLILPLGKEVEHCGRGTFFVFRVKIDVIWYDEYLSQILELSHGSFKVYFSAKNPHYCWRYLLIQNQNQLH